MQTSNYTTSIVVDNTAAEVYRAINNVSEWWQGAIIGQSNKVDDEFSYRMEEFHFSKQKVLELIPDEKVVWLVTESQLNFTQKADEWTGTKIIFEIAERNHQTQMLFTHQGLVPAIECYGACSGAWQQLIQESLFSLITTGKGTKVFG